MLIFLVGFLCFVTAIFGIAVVLLRRENSELLRELAESQLLIEQLTETEEEVFSVRRKLPDVSKRMN